jgi:lysophospholipase L1-like esterase
MPTPPSPPGRFRRLLPNLLLAAPSLAAGLGALEASCRLRQADGEPWRFVSRLHGNIPRNSLGFRDHEYPRPKPAGVFRILVLGDSFTQGVGVGFDESYPERLERLLNLVAGGSGPDFQVLNLGLPQRSTPQELRLLRKMAPELEPDLVLVGYCLNDAEDWDDAESTRALRQRTGYLDQGGLPGWLGRLASPSALAELVDRRLGLALSRRRQTSYYRALYRPGAGGWEKIRAALGELSAWSRREGTPVVVAVFPLLSYGLDGGYPFPEIHRLLDEELKHHHLPHLDLLPFFRNQSRERIEADPGRDPHPSAIGHSIAAEAILGHLCRHGFLPMACDPGHPVESPAPLPPGRSGQPPGENG